MENIILSPESLTLTQLVLGQGDTELAIVRAKLDVEHQEKIRDRYEVEINRRNKLVSDLLGKEINRDEFVRLAQALKLS